MRTSSPPLPSRTYATSGCATLAVVDDGDMVIAPRSRGEATNAPTPATPAAVLAEVARNPRRVSPAIRRSSSRSGGPSGAKRRDLRRRALPCAYVPSTHSDDRWIGYTYRLIF